MADPTHVRFFDACTFRHLCHPDGDGPVFEPVTVTTDDDTVFADLEPVRGDQSLPRTSSSPASSARRAAPAGVPGG